MPTSPVNPVEQEESSTRQLCTGCRRLVQGFAKGKSCTNQKPVDALGLLCLNGEALHSALLKESSMLPQKRGNLSEGARSFWRLCVC